MGANLLIGPNADLMADALGLIAEAQAENIRRVSDWYAIKRLVSRNFAPQVLPVGYQIGDEWRQTENDSPLTAIWDVVHHDAQGMFLNWHYALPDPIPFDAPEAIYYADGTEAAGDCYITVGAAYGTGWTAGTNIQITLTDALDAGDQLEIDCGQSNARNPAAGRTWRVYAAGTMTVKQSGVTSSGSTGVKLGETAGNSAQKTNGRINAPARVVYGYGRWSQSAIRQYLNSAEAAGSWWTMQNPWDRPPAQHTTLRGFLAGYSEDFLAAIATTDVVTALNTAEGFDTTTEVTQDKIFLPCLNNWYISPQLAGEGDAWDYYEALAQEAGISGKFKTGSTYPILIKYRLDIPSTPVAVCLRSCNRSTASNAWNVASTGNVDSGSACVARRGCPACKIVKSV